MPDRLESMSVFVRVAELGSFSAAATALSISPQMVAKHIEALEKRLGTRLIHRTTRRHSLTDFGRQYRDRCKAILADVADAEAQASETGSEPRGLLRINAPVTFGAQVLVPLVTAYLRAHPQVTCDLVLSDRYVDPIEEGFDLVFRIGPLSGPLSGPLAGQLTQTHALLAHPLTPYRLVACAAPAYLAEHGTPETPEDLRNHECLGFSPWSGPLGREWPFSKGGETVEVPSASRLSINDWRAIHQAALDGFGITLGYESAVADDLTSGRLVRLLPDYEGPARPFHLLHARERRMRATLSGFLARILARFSAKS
ncbi:LysR family transcriptional regulator [Afifella sp. YEN Y35]|uniref:LysR family transcriptional regulator n=1 Tax=Afifella sp. YEN Y35 TaxID=3388337 RepID=UPI0039E0A7D0